MAQPSGIFCLKISKDHFNPISLIDFLKSFEEFTINEASTKTRLEHGIFVCSTCCGKAQFRLNYEYKSAQENYRITLRRFSGDGYTAAVIMKKVFKLIPSLFDLVLD